MFLLNVLRFKKAQIYVCFVCGNLSVGKSA